MTRRKSDVFGLATLPPLASVSLRKSRRLSEIGVPVLPKSSSLSSSISLSAVAVVAVDLSVSATAAAAASDEKSSSSLKCNDGSVSMDSLKASATRTSTPVVDDNRGVQTKKKMMKNEPSKNDDNNDAKKSSVTSSSPRKQSSDDNDNAAVLSHAAVAAVASASSSPSSSSSGNHHISVQSSSSYFLQDIDFESCPDVMSLPDPPDTPVGDDGGDSAVVVVRGGPPSSSSSILLRRMSSPLVRPPLRDSTNNELLGIMDDSKVTTRKKKKRTRKTMFELSSLTTSSAAGVAVVTFSNIAANKNNAILPLSSSVETTASTTTSSFSKRRKKRQSIVLPSDAAETMEMEMEEDGDDDSTSPTSTDFIQTFSTFKKESSSTSSSTTSSTSSSTWAKDDVARIPAKPDANMLAELRRLVHDYTDLPKSARAASNEAKTIREMTGYILTSTAANVDDVGPNNNDNNDVDDDGDVGTMGMSRQEKFALLQGMETDLRRLDATKVLDAQIVATVTQCRVQKVRNNGSFRYFLDQTGEHVSPREYETRYMRMLQEINHLRSAAWSSYFDQLENDDCWKTVVVVPSTPENQEEHSDKDTRGGADNQSSSCPEADCPIDEEPLVHSSQDDEQSNTSSPQRKVSPPLISKRQHVDVEAPVEMDVVVDDADAVLALLAPPQPASTLFSEEHDDDDDPEMARAVQKLHATMDRALATYAEEVMAIQAARAQKKRARREGQS